MIPALRIVLLEQVGLAHEVEQSVPIIIGKFRVRIALRVIAHVTDAGNETARFPVETEATASERGNQVLPADPDLGVIADKARIACLQRHISHGLPQLRHLQFSGVTNGILHINNGKAVLRRLRIAATGCQQAGYKDGSYFFLSHKMVVLDLANAKVGNIPGGYPRRRGIFYSPQNSVTRNGTLKSTRNP